MKAEVKAVPSQMYIVTNSFIFSAVGGGQTPTIWYG